MASAAKVEISADTARELLADDLMVTSLDPEWVDMTESGSDSAEDVAFGNLTCSSSDSDMYERDSDESATADQAAAPSFEPADKSCADESSWLTEDNDMDEEESMGGTFASRWKSSELWRVGNLARYSQLHREPEPVSAMSSVLDSRRELRTARQMLVERGRRRALDAAVAEGATINCEFDSPPEDHEARVRKVLEDTFERLKMEAKADGGRQRRRKDPRRRKVPSVWEREFDCIRLLEVSSDSEEDEKELKAVNHTNTYYKHEGYSELYSYTDALLKCRDEALRLALPGRRAAGGTVEGAGDLKKESVAPAGERLVSAAPVGASASVSVIPSAVSASAPAAASPASVTAPGADADRLEDEAGLAKALCAVSTKRTKPRPVKSVYVSRPPPGSRKTKTAKAASSLSMKQQAKKDKKQKKKKKNKEKKKKSKKGKSGKKGSDQASMKSEGGEGEVEGRGRTIIRRRWRCRGCQFVNEIVDIACAKCGRVSPTRKAKRRRALAKAAKLAQQRGESVAQAEQAVLQDLANPRKRKRDEQQTEGEPAGFAEAKTGTKAEPGQDSAHRLSEAAAAGVKTKEEDGAKASSKAQKRSNASKKTKENGAASLQPSTDEKPFATGDAPGMISASDGDALDQNFAAKRREEARAWRASALETSSALEQPKESNDAASGSAAQSASVSAELAREWWRERIIQPACQKGVVSKRVARLRKFRERKLKRCKEVATACQRRVRERLRRDLKKGSARDAMARGRKLGKELLDSVLESEDYLAAVEEQTALREEKEEERDSRARILQSLEVKAKKEKRDLQGMRAFLLTEFQLFCESLLKSDGKYFPVPALPDPSEVGLLRLKKTPERVTRILEPPSTSSPPRPSSVYAWSKDDAGSCTASPSSSPSSSPITTTATSTASTSLSTSSFSDSPVVSTDSSVAAAAAVSSVTTLSPVKKEEEVRKELFDAAADQAGQKHGTEGDKSINNENSSNNNNNNNNKSNDENNDDSEKESNALVPITSGASESDAQSIAEACVRAAVSLAHQSVSAALSLREMGLKKLRDEWMLLYWRALGQSNVISVGGELVNPEEVSRLASKISNPFSAEGGDAEQWAWLSDVHEALSKLGRDAFIETPEGALLPKDPLVTAAGEMYKPYEGEFYMRGEDKLDMLREKLAAGQLRGCLTKPLRVLHPPEERERQAEAEGQAMIEAEAEANTEEKPNTEGEGKTEAEAKTGEEGKTEEGKTEAEAKTGEEGKTEEGKTEEETKTKGEAKRKEEATEKSGAAPASVVRSASTNASEYQATASGATAAAGAAAAGAGPGTPTTPTTESPAAPGRVRGGGGGGGGGGGEERRVGGGAGTGATPAARGTGAAVPAAADPGTNDSVADSGESLQHKHKHNVDPPGDHVHDAQTDLTELTEEQRRMQAEDARIGGAASGAVPQTTAQSPPRRYTEAALTATVSCADSRFRKLRTLQEKNLNGVFLLGGEDDDEKEEGGGGGAAAGGGKGGPRGSSLGLARIRHELIALFAKSAVEDDVWGLHMVVAAEETLEGWAAAIAELCPDLRVLPYWGEARDRTALRTWWNAQQLYTAKANFHVVLTSFQLVCEDMLHLAELTWQSVFFDRPWELMVDPRRAPQWTQMLTLRCRQRLMWLPQLSKEVLIGKLSSSSSSGSKKSSSSCNNNDNNTNTNNNNDNNSNNENVTGSISTPASAVENGSGVNGDQEHGLRREGLGLGAHSGSGQPGASDGSTETHNTRQLAVKSSAGQNTVEVGESKKETEKGNERDKGKEEERERERKREKGKEKQRGGKEREKETIHLNIKLLVHFLLPGLFRSTDSVSAWAMCQLSKEDYAFLWRSLDPLIITGESGSLKDNMQPFHTFSQTLVDMKARTDLEAAKKVERARSKRRASRASLSKLSRRRRKKLEESAKHAEKSKDTKSTKSGEETEVPEDLKDSKGTKDTKSTNDVKDAKNAKVTENQRNTKIGAEGSGETNEGRSKSSGEAEAERDNIAGLVAGSLKESSGGTVADRIGDGPDGPKKAQFAATGGPKSTIELEKLTTTPATPATTMTSQHRMGQPSLQPGLVTEGQSIPDGRVVQSKERLPQSSRAFVTEALQASSETKMAAHMSHEGRHAVPQPLVAADASARDSRASAVASSGPVAAPFLAQAEKGPSGGQSGPVPMPMEVEMASDSLFATMQLPAASAGGPGTSGVPQNGTGSTAGLDLDLLLQPPPVASRPISQFSASSASSTVTGDSSRASPSFLGATGGRGAWPASSASSYAPTASSCSSSSSSSSLARPVNHLVSSVSASLSSASAASAPLQPGANASAMDHFGPVAPPRDLGVDTMDSVPVSASAPIPFPGHHEMSQHSTMEPPATFFFQHEQATSAPHGQNVSSAQANPQTAPSVDMSVERSGAQAQEEAEHSKNTLAEYADGRILAAQLEESRRDLRLPLGEGQEEVGEEPEEKEEGQEGEGEREEEEEELEEDEEEDGEEEEDGQEEEEEEEQEEGDSQQSANESDAADYDAERHARSTPGRRKKRTARCMKCAGCLAEDCLKCLHCKDMKKYGGPGLRKQGCKARKCLNPVATSPEEEGDEGEDEYDRVASAEPGVGRGSQKSPARALHGQKGSFADASEMGGGVAIDASAIFGSMTLDPSTGGFYITTADGTMLPVDHQEASNGGAERADHEAPHSHSQLPQQHTEAHIGTNFMDMSHHPHHPHPGGVRPPQSQLQLQQRQHLADHPDPEHHMHLAAAAPPGSHTSGAHLADESEALLHAMMGQVTEDPRGGSGGGDSFVKFGRGAPELLKGLDEAAPAAAAVHGAGGAAVDGHDGGMDLDGDLMMNLVKAEMDKDSVDLYDVLQAEVHAENKMGPAGRGRGRGGGRGRRKKSVEGGLAAAAAVNPSLPTSPFLAGDGRKLTKKEKEKLMEREERRSSTGGLGRKRGRTPKKAEEEEEEAELPEEDTPAVGKSPKGAAAAAKVRTTRCGTCAGCLAEDCRRCSHCRDMKKYGGPGVRKKSCKKKVCLAPQVVSASSGKAGDGEGEGEGDSSAEEVGGPAKGGGQRGGGGARKRGRAGGKHGGKGKGKAGNAAAAEDEESEELAAVNVDFLTQQKEEIEFRLEQILGSELVEKMKAVSGGLFSPYESASSLSTALFRDPLLPMDVEKDMPEPMAVATGLEGPETSPHMEAKGSLMLSMLTGALPREMQEEVAALRQHLFLVVRALAQEKRRQARLARNRRLNIRCQSSATLRRRVEVGKKKREMERRELAAREKQKERIRLQREKQRAQLQKEQGKGKGKKAGGKGESAGDGKSGRKRGWDDGEAAAGPGAKRQKGGKASSAAQLTSADGLYKCSQCEMKFEKAAQVGAHVRVYHPKEGSTFGLKSRLAREAGLKGGAKAKAGKQAKKTAGKSKSKKPARGKSKGRGKPPKKGKKALARVPQKKGSRRFRNIRAQKVVPVTTTGPVVGLGMASNLFGGALGGVKATGRKKILKKGGKGGKSTAAAEDDETHDTKEQQSKAKGKGGATAAKAAGSKRKGARGRQSAQLSPYLDQQREEVSKVMAVYRHILMAWSDAVKPPMAYAKLEGPNFLHYMVHSRIVLGRVSDMWRSAYNRYGMDLARGASGGVVDCHLGEEEELVAHQHAIISWNAPAKCFEIRCISALSPVIVDGMEVASGSPPRTLPSRALVQIGTSVFFFLLAKPFKPSPDVSSMDKLQDTAIIKVKEEPQLLH